MDISTNEQPVSDAQIFAEIVKDQIPELFCDACGFYPIEPVHGHFVCPSCKMPTKCCEGLPQ